jgi:hypothetical protein
MMTDLGRTVRTKPHHLHAASATQGKVMLGRPPGLDMRPDVVPPAFPRAVRVLAMILVSTALLCRQLTSHRGASCHPSTAPPPLPQAAHHLHSSATPGASGCQRGQGVAGLLHMQNRSHPCHPTDNTWTFKWDGADKEDRLVRRCPTCRALTQHASLLYTLFPLRQVQCSKQGGACCGALPLIVDLWLTKGMAY